jgi:hypothetical protein
MPITKTNICTGLAVQKDRFCGTLHFLICMLCMFMKSACVFDANFKILTGCCPYVYLSQRQNKNLTRSSMTHFGDMSGEQLAIVKVVSSNC